MAKIYNSYQIIFNNREDAEKYKYYLIYTFKDNLTLNMNFSEYLWVINFEIEVPGMGVVLNLKKVWVDHVPSLLRDLDNQTIVRSGQTLESPTYMGTSLIGN